MILTGMATDFNSGLLLVVMALAVWPGKGIAQPASARTLRAAATNEEIQAKDSGSAQHA